uniref:Uncharacterized protein n=1 Tax=Haptolina ericina TaxID=156174 RepID=A0A7S3AKD9_9EUKA|mmetsp:Transcript_21894/g.49364  ORF Transcript_21894/g.49364 Transcript_21894/m.49364 type:complete len:347 (+) Transcript_21894:134-1174(+)|eukprot:CAMPEP_0181192216 /NCGR_PEP_ID=MMETSP1096-20121128/13163_1 /TAXON_ID=156174 ORGANISM="Chrysochromulina ericina, Strain CCMP281" /NCGR_SAMPLE_ID=MMETSP1096 /ASSEMBLY_ACC=CAM_ASM_000453 /LENGTH=346 /DNA_ID=CAMNT_0023281593 /DNA_START=68 /DNA_END=1108 /DNA_ORIENTATION=+
MLVKHPTTGKTFEYIDAMGKKVPMTIDEPLITTISYDAERWAGFDAAYGRIYGYKQVNPECGVFPFGMCVCLCDNRVQQYYTGARKYTPSPCPSKPDKTASVALMITEKGLLYPNNGKPGLTWDNIDLDSVRVLKSTPGGCTCFPAAASSGRVVPLKRLPGPESLHWQMLWGIFFPCCVTTCKRQHVPGYFELVMRSKSRHLITDGDGMEFSVTDLTMTCRALKADPDQLLAKIREAAAAGKAWKSGDASTDYAPAAAPIEGALSNWGGDVTMLSDGARGGGGGGGSLLEGTYDEDEAAASFQAALMAWRKGDETPAPEPEKIDRTDFADSTDSADSAGIDRSEAV